jgi:hypothetical protein
MDFDSIKVRTDAANIISSGEAENYLDYLINNNFGERLSYLKSQAMSPEGQAILIHCLKNDDEHSIYSVSPIREKIYELMFQGKNLEFFPSVNKLFGILFEHGPDYIFMEKFQDYCFHNPHGINGFKLHSFSIELIKAVKNLKDGDYKDACRQEIFHQIFLRPTILMSDDALLNFANQNPNLIDYFAAIDKGELSKWLFNEERNIKVSNLWILKSQSVKWITSEAAPKIMSGIEEYKNLREFMNTFIHICTIGRTDLVFELYSKQSQLLQLTWKAEYNFNELKRHMDKYSKSLEA